MTNVAQPGSSSVVQPGYWWFAARSVLLRAALEPWLGRPQRVLDVGSADAPSAAWMRGDHEHVSVDLDPRGLVPGHGICASALALPFADATFDVVAAFDVIEHCEPEGQAVGELVRVLVPGGRLLVSVPAYQWAWSDHDVRAGHHRRYTRQRIVAVLESAGLRIDRATYAFAAVFPLFAVERLSRRVRHLGDAERLPRVAPAAGRVLEALCAGEARVLRHRDLPFGSSVVVAAVKP
jgi:SAM-dependent methyltransferase